MRLLPAITDGSNGLNSRSAFGDWAFVSNGLQINARDPKVLEALLRAFDWLIFNGLLSFGARSYGSWADLTKLGREMLDDPNALQKIEAIKRISIDLHPRLDGRIQPQFLLGEYEPAVFLAFREVEIRVRELSSSPDSLIGVKLMRKAFNPQTGPLADHSLDDGEKVAIMELFAGAIGAFKNPPSHRQVDYADVTVASEAVMLAGLLLRMLDRYDGQT